MCCAEKKRLVFSLPWNSSQKVTCSSLAVQNNAQTLQRKPIFSASRFVPFRNISIITIDSFVCKKAMYHPVCTLFASLYMKRTLPIFTCKRNILSKFANLSIFLKVFWVFQGYIKLESEESKPFVKTEKNFNPKISVQRNTKNFKMVNPVKLVSYSLLSCFTKPRVVSFSFEGVFIAAKTKYVLSPS